MHLKLSTEQLSELYELIEATITDCEEKLANPNLETGTVDLDESIGRLSRMDSLARQQMAIASKKRLESVMKRSRLALTSIQDGTYGTCQDCGENIPYPRLKNSPCAALCIQCQEIAES